jgi:hypothetical protein
MFLSFPDCLRASWPFSSFTMFLKTPFSLEQNRDAEDVELNRDAQQRGMTHLDTRGSTKTINAPLCHIEQTTQALTCQTFSRLGGAQNLGHAKQQPHTSGLSIVPFWGALMF